MATLHLCSCLYVTGMWEWELKLIYAEDEKERRGQGTKNQALGRLRPYTP